MLYASYPLTLVHATISPKHLTIPMPLVIQVVAFVYVPAGPSIHSVPALLVILVIAFIIIVSHLIFGTFPASFTVFDSSEELAGIDLSVCPGVLAFAMGLSVEVLPSVDVT